MKKIYSNPQYLFGYFVLLSIFVNEIIFMATKMNKKKSKKDVDDKGKTIRVSSFAWSAIKTHCSKNGFVIGGYIERLALSDINSSLPKKKTA